MTKTKSATKKSNVKKSNTVAVNGQALKKAIDDRVQPKAEPTVETKSRFHIWDVYGVKYLMDENMVPTRRVSMIEVTSDHDTANEPDLRNALIDDAENQLVEEGFFMTDVAAMEDALRNFEPCLDNIRHNIKYGEVCPRCAADKLDTALNWLEYLRSWRERRFALADELGGTCNLPPVIPNDYQENWHVENDQLVPNVKKPAVAHEVRIEGVKTPTDLAKAISKAELPLPQEIKDQFMKAVEGAIDKTKKLPPAPEKKQIANKK